MRPATQVGTFDGSKALEAPSIQKVADSQLSVIAPLLGRSSEGAIDIVCS